MQATLTVFPPVVPNTHDVGNANAKWSRRIGAARRWLWFSNDWAANDNLRDAFIDRAMTVDREGDLLPSDRSALVRAEEEMKQASMQRMPLRPKRPRPRRS